MKSQHEMQIRDALINIDFKKFLAIVATVNSSYERYNFALQALAVAKQHKNSHALKQLVDVALDCWDKERLFEQILLELVALSEIDIALGIVIRYQPDEFALYEAWYLLAKALLTCNELNEIKYIVGYIKHPQQQAEVLRTCLDKVALPENLLIWLEWFDLYTQAGVFINPAEYHDAVVALADFPDFKLACHHLQKLKPSTGKENLVRQLYLHLVNEQEHIKLQQLEPILTVEIAWLVNIAAWVESGSHCDVLEKLELHEALPVIKLAISELLVRHEECSEHELAEIIIKLASSSEKYQEQICEIACKTCLSNTRLDALIPLLPLVNKQAKTSIMLAMITYPLSTPHYEIILQHIDNLEAPSDECRYLNDEEKIIKHIPPALIANEFKRRAQTLISESQQKFSNINKIHSNHPLYRAITKTIDELILHQQFNIAFTLCQKLVLSKYRDSYLITLFQDTLICSDFSLAKKLLKFISNKEKQQSLNQLLIYFQVLNHRKAFKQLIKMSRSNEFEKLLLFCIHNILSEENRLAALNFMINNGIFQLDVVYFSENFTNTIKEVVHLLLSYYKDEIALIKLIANLNQRKIKNFEPYLLSKLLENNRIAAAIQLFNTCWVLNGHGYKELPSTYAKLQEELDDYFENCQPCVKNLNALGVLEDEYLQRRWIVNLLRIISDNPSESDLELFAAIPVESIKSEYLVPVIIRNLQNNNMALAKRAASLLSQERQIMWLKIISFTEQGNVVEILNYIIKNSLQETTLLDWAVERWCVQSSPAHLLTNVLIFCRRLNDLSSKIRSEEVNDYSSLFVKQKILHILISRTLFHWQEMLMQVKAYPQFLLAIEDLLPFTDILHPYVDLFEQLRSVVNVMLVERRYDNARIGLVILIKQQKNFLHSHFEKMFDIVLKNNDLEIADKMLLLIPRNENDWYRERLILNLARKYFSIEKHEKCIAVLKDAQKSHSLESQVKEWVVRLINSDKVDVATNFADNLLSADNEAIFIEIIDHLLTKKKLFPTINYVRDKISTPSVLIRLRNELSMVYLSKLESWIGKDLVNSLKQAHHKLEKFLFLVKEAGQIDVCNQLKNEILLELRGQLDKAFLAFCRSQYGEPLTKLLNIYFPCVPDLTGKSVKERLNDYFRKRKMPNFAVEHPELFRYLLHIQPLSNANYQWLQQLYNMVNIHKHARDLPLQPKVDGVIINMEVYLPKLLDGVTELLFKLKMPKVEVRTICNLRFCRFVPMQVVRTPIAPLLQNIGLFQQTTSKQQVIVAANSAKPHQFNRPLPTMC